MISKLPAAWIAMAAMTSLLPAEIAPAERLDLSAWKLTLPIADGSSERPKEIKQPELSSFIHADYFFANSKANTVIFRAPCGGTTTKGSSYPRCELREMTDEGKSRASWATDDGMAHTMTMQVAIHRTPEIKKHVVCAQIHDRDDDLMMIRLEGNHLFIERKPHEDVTLDRNYVLGTMFDLKIQAHDSVVKVWHDGVQKMAWKVAREGCYFKAGCYTQSNVKKGDAADSFGEVAIHRLKLDHETFAGNSEGSFDEEK